STWNTGGAGVLQRHPGHWIVSARKVASGPRAVAACGRGPALQPAGASDRSPLLDLRVLHAGRPARERTANRALAREGRGAWGPLHPGEPRLSESTAPP